MTTTSDAYHKINALTHEQREAAYQAARLRLAGREPQAQDYATHEGKHPAWMTRLVTLLSLLMLIASFLPSAMRLNAIALELARPVVVHTLSVYVAAVCVVLMAEIGQVIYSLAATSAEGRAERNSLWVGSVICLAIALIGNAVAEWQHILDNALAPLVTFAPPVLVLITATVLKRQMLKSVDERHEARLAFRRDFDAWRFEVANADQDAAWDRTLANALRDALRNANKQSKAVIRELTAFDWHALVLRERHAEEWWDAVSQAQEAEQARSTRSGTQSTQATGEAAQAETLRLDGAFVKVCPECGEHFAGETQRQATNKLVAHFKRHRNEERKAVALNGKVSE